MEKPDAIWTTKTTEYCRMQSTDGKKSDKKLFSKVRSLPRLHLILNTLNIVLDYIMRQTT